jgi:hypothetical protein
LRWDIDAPGLQNALNSNSSIIASGGVDVSRQGDGQFLIAYRAVGAVSTILFNGALLVPDCTITSLVLTTGTSTARQFLMVTIARVVPLQTTTFTAIVSPYAGYQGYLRLISSTAMELIRMNGVKRGNFLECQSVINVEIIDTNGNVMPFYQSPVLLRALNYSLESLTPIPPVVAFTQYFFARPAIVGLASNTVARHCLVVLPQVAMLTLWAVRYNVSLAMTLWLTSSVNHLRLLRTCRLWCVLTTTTLQPTPINGCWIP